MHLVSEGSERADVGVQFVGVWSLPIVRRPLERLRDGSRRIPDRVVCAVEGRQEEESFENALPNEWVQLSHLLVGQVRAVEVLDRVPHEAGDQHGRVGGIFHRWNRIAATAAIRSNRAQVRIRGTGTAEGGIA